MVTIRSTEKSLRKFAGAGTISEVDIRLTLEPVGEETGLREITRLSPEGTQLRLAASNWVEEHSNYLYRFAYSRVMDQSLSEDLVQETLLAALKSWERFAGRSSIRTWLVSILKNKIVDHFRRAATQDRESVESFYQDEVREHFESNGHWRLESATTPNEWVPPQESELEQKEFREQLQRCLRRLPPRVREVFVLREMEDFSSEEICQLLGISRQNLWSVMHRARMALRDCIDIHWYQASRA